MSQFLGFAAPCASLAPMACLSPADVIGRARSRPKIYRFAALGALFLTLGCTAAIGAGVAVTAAGAAFIATPCYGYVQATVIDGRTGAQTCDADLVAISGDREERFTPCYYAPLPEGKWQIRASGAGLPDSVTDVEIPEPTECSRVIHSVVLTMGATPAPAFGSQRVAEQPALPAAPIATEPAPPSAPPPIATSPAPPGAAAAPPAAPPAPVAPAPADAGSAPGRLPDVPPSPARPAPR